MRRTLIVDWLDKYGGAERVIASLQNAFRFETMYALVNIMKPVDLKKITSNAKVEIITTPLQIFANFFRFFFFLFHYFISKIKVDRKFGTIISSSHAIAKGVVKSDKKQLHISYFQARNFKYIWDDAGLYFGKTRFIFQQLISYLQKIDYKQAQRPDFIISNSHFVKNWVKDKYHRDSVVIYPPVDVQQFVLQVQKEDYFVAVGRIVAYKRFDLIVEAFNQTNEKLIIIGDGPELKKLKKKARSNICFTGYIDAKTVHQYISKAKGFLHIGIEDFGIAPIEAQATGTPVIAYNAGGIKETVLHQKTGILFQEQTAEALLEAIALFETMNWNYEAIHHHVQFFATDRFEKELLSFVEKCEMEASQDVLKHRKR
ncbi:MAG TPA: glycosyltransferase [Flavobacterium sp.]|nr:glycosyltransferase [Flavobacterium sp.]